MVGWHRQLDEDEFEQALGVGDVAALHGIAKSQTQLSDSTELNVTDTFKENKYY